MKTLSVKVFTFTFVSHLGFACESINDKVEILQYLILSSTEGRLRPAAAGAGRKRSLPTCLSVTP